jgi:hypothetical protein
VVIKFARWAFEKFRDAEDRLGTQMRAVGEVMSIGNITVGGTGKTPAVVMACRFLRSMGKNPGVILRGYGEDERYLLDGALRALICSTAERAEAEIDVLMPGYTHLQPAQPTTLAHHLLAYEGSTERGYRIPDRFTRFAARLLESGARFSVRPLSMRNLERLTLPRSAELVGVSTVAQAMELLF